MRLTLLLTALLAVLPPAQAENESPNSKPICYDDCGEPGNQPHVIHGQGYALDESLMEGGRKATRGARTIVYDAKSVQVQYQGLATSAHYRLKVVYASEKGVLRKQSLTAGTLEIHPAMELPQGEAKTYEFAVPASAVAAGTLDLSFNRIKGANAVVSEIWLLSDVPQSPLAMEVNGGLGSRVTVRVFEGMNLKAVANALVTVTDSKGAVVEGKTDGNGNSVVDLNRLEGNIQIAAKQGDRAIHKALPFSSLVLQPPVYEPLCDEIPGIAKTSLSLNGKWRFSPSPDDRFWDPRVNDTWWAPIEVPGQWVEQGFSPDPSKPAGYRFSFSTPSEWKGQTVRLRFDAVYSLAKVWLNGKLLGEHEGGFTPFEFDVTKELVADGRNVLALAVTNNSLADHLSSMSGYAQHPLGGISRKVTLFAVPPTHLKRFQGLTSFDKDYQNALLKVRAAAEGSSAGQCELRVSVTPLGKISAPIAQASAKPDSNGRISMDIPVAAPAKWDAEHPNLYLMQGELVVNGTVAETVSRRIGFRQVEIRGTQFLVNGRPIKFRGVERHEEDPLRGRSLTMKTWKRDIELLKEANVNNVFTCHYPPAEEFMDLCDQEGLWVIEESPMVWVSWSLAEDPANLSTVARPITEMIERDMSRPGVVVWMLADESAWGKNFQTAVDYLKKEGEDLPLMFSWDKGGPSRLSLASAHYPAVEEIGKFANSDRPVTFDQYMHVNCYNRRENLADPGLRDVYGEFFEQMFDEMYRTPALVGGQVWAWSDDVFLLGPKKAVGYGEWGIVDGWRRPKPEWWHMKMVYAPVKILVRDVPLPAAGSAIELPVENRYDFTNLSELSIQWELNGESGTSRADVPPRSSGKLLICPKTVVKNGDRLAVKFFDGSRRLVNTYLLTLGKPATVIPAPGLHAGKLTLLTPDNNPLAGSRGSFIIRGGGFEWEIDAKTGQLRTGKIGGKTVLTGGPALMILPMDCGPNPLPSSDLCGFQPFTPFCTGWKARSVQAVAGERGIEIRVSGSYAEADGIYTLHFGADKTLAVDYRFECCKPVDPRQIGMVFDVPLDCDTLTWKRNAHWTVYPDDHIGRPEGKAVAFRKGKWIKPQDIRTRPDCSWSQDETALGSNDFRSTKHNILRASLTDSINAGIAVTSPGTQHVRAWIDTDRIHWLIAQYSNGGDDYFTKRHFKATWRPLKSGSVVEDCVHLELFLPLKPGEKGGGAILLKSGGNNR